MFLFWHGRKKPEKRRLSVFFTVALSGMKKSFFSFFLPVMWTVFCLCSCNQSCSLVEGKKNAGVNSVKVLNWNLQTFFDGNFNGNEYSEFSSGAAGWNKEKYDVRLERLSEVVKSVDPDIFVMQELESEDQLYDIFNRLCSNFSLSKNYGYGCFFKEEGGAIGCGVLSRYPLFGKSVHSLDIRSEEESQPSMRPLLKVFVNVNDRPLLLLINHWKSKSGGEEKSEVWRNYQEAVLAETFVRCAEEKIPAAACGDFNRDILEFRKIAGRKLQFNVELNGENPAQVYSPWYDSGGNLLEPGSYFYNGNWERIDHFFAGSGVSLCDFKVENKGSWANADGTPAKYIVKYGSGYSDHFPVSCVVTW